MDIILPEKRMPFCGVKGDDKDGWVDNLVKGTAHCSSKIDLKNASKQVNLNIKVR
jgi:hypothetical protein